jgi:hypothetical protein
MDMNDARLGSENAMYARTGGVSGRNGHLGFHAAFLDYATMRIYPSRFADGRPAPFHLLDGLPNEIRAKPTVISGFERAGFFYTRRAAARACEQWAH